MNGWVVGLLGSGEFLPWAGDVDRALLAAARAGDGSAVILPTASAPEGDQTFERWAQMGTDHYASLGVDARVIRLRTRDDAMSASMAEEIGEASLVFFSGGNPAYVSSVLRDTPFLDAMLAAMDRGVAVAGCSAGACMFGEVAPDPTFISDPEQVFGFRGLSLIPGVVFGAHWNELENYYPGLQTLALKYVPSGMRMIGLDEDTAMVSGGDGAWRVYGASSVHIYNGGPSPDTYAAGTTFTL